MFHLARSEPGHRRLSKIDGRWQFLMVFVDGDQGGGPIAMAVADRVVDYEGSAKMFSPDSWSR
jgi:hypothetical protein